MRRAQKLAVALLGIAVLGPASFGFAQQATTLDADLAEKPPARGSAWTIGLGAAAVPDYEGSSDYKGAPLLYLRGAWSNGMYVNFFGTTLTANILPSPVWEAGPLVRYRAARKDVENDKVDKMEDVDAATELGGFIGFRYMGWGLRFEGASDVSGNYSGYVLTLKGSYTKKVNDRFTLAFGLSTTYADENYMQTYFGVNAEDSIRSGLDRYDADAGIKDVSGSILAMYHFTPEWGLLGGVRYSQLLGDAADSPLVDDEGSAGQVVVGLAVTYTF